MKDFLVRIIAISLLFCTGCFSGVPDPVETNIPTVMERRTAESEGITPSVIITAPTVTATQTHKIIVASPSSITDIPEHDQNLLDFNRYGPIAYIAETLKGVSIQMINPDGSPVNWKFEAEEDFLINEIAWSPDGSTFVLASEDGIYLQSIEGKGLIHLQATSVFSIISSPSFSPDGNFITFFAYNEGAIFRINTDGDGLINLTPEASYRNSFESPSWSSSGDQILFSRPFTDGSIYIMNADGTGSRKLIDVGWNDKPRLSSDGKWLAFIRYNDSQGFLYAMPLAGGTYRSLSSNQHDVISYSWSPDGRYLVFNDFICDGECEHKYWMVEFETLETWQLSIPKDVFVRSLEWSPLMMVAEKYKDCTGGWSRLEIGKLVHLIGNVPNRVRSAPQKGENAVGQFDTGETYYLLDGPVCGEGLVWWVIADPRLNGGAGWTAEGDGQAYWLELIFQ